jgi:flagellum-specific peptidoglycan hydrolase FlgJ
MPGEYPDLIPPDSLRNFESPVKTSGKYWNAPENVPNIENGWNFYKNGLYEPSDKAEGQKEKAGKPANQPARRPGPHTEAPGWMQAPAPTNHLEHPSFPDPFWTGSPSFMSSLPPSQTGNLLASPPALFEQPYEKAYSPVRQAQAGPASSSPEKTFYSLKDKLNFIRRVYPLAKGLSDKTGLSLPFILAHTAHEVDWGKKIEGNNLFNLKADENWQGPTYKRGNTDYRAYPSYDESMKDYLSFLDNNPRMSTMLAPVIRESVGRLGRAIHYSGYSDDPLYGRRITTVARSPLMKWALWQSGRLPQEGSQEG